MDNPWPFDISYVYWAALVAVFFGVREFVAAVFTPKRKDTFSEFVWWAFDRRWEKVILAMFLASLTTHFIWRTHWWSLAALGAAMVYVVADAFRRRDMAKTYSAKKGASKLFGTALEVVTAILVASLPQIIGVVLGTAEVTDPAQLGIPAEWATAWFFIIRFARNAWKNRSTGVMGQQ